MKGIKICKTRLTEYKKNRLVEVRMTFLGYLFRNRWQVSMGDFERDYMDQWIPCYISLRGLLGITQNREKAS